MNEIILSAYRACKESYPEHVLIVRLGDFYEAFESDAQTVSEVCQVGLGNFHGVPMSGFPYWTATARIQELLEAGHKVAVAEKALNDDPVLHT